MTIFTSQNGTDLVTAVQNAISGNIAAVLIVLGAIVGLKFATRLVNGAVSRGKLKV